MTRKKSLAALFMALMVVSLELTAIYCPKHRLHFDPRLYGLDCPKCCKGNKPAPRTGGFAHDLGGGPGRWMMPFLPGPGSVGMPVAGFPLPVRMPFRQPVACLPCHVIAHQQENALSTHVQEQSAEQLKVSILHLDILHLSHSGVAGPSNDQSGQRDPHSVTVNIVSNFFNNNPQIYQEPAAGQVAGFQLTSTGSQEGSFELLYQQPEFPGQVTGYILVPDVGLLLIFYGAPNTNHAGIIEFSMHSLSLSSPMLMTIELWRLLERINAGNHEYFLYIPERRP